MHRASLPAPRARARPPGRRRDLHMAATAPAPSPAIPEPMPVLSHDPLALLIGMLLDQQVTIEKAFFVAAELARRLGGSCTRRPSRRWTPMRWPTPSRNGPRLHRFRSRWRGACRTSAGCDRAQGLSERPRPFRGGHPHRCGARRTAQGVARFRRAKGRVLWPRCWASSSVRPNSG